MIEGRRHKAEDIRQKTEGKNENVLIVFLKYPEPGKVKTRLANDIGAKKAAELYRFFCEAILSRTKSSFYHQIVFFAPESKEQLVHEWLGKSHSLQPQKGNDLGQRMSNAFAYCFNNGAKKVVIVGTDALQATSNHVLRSIELLTKNDCVIGPSLDGGYYLLGLSSMNKSLFEKIDWSTNKVLSQTLNSLEGLNSSFTLLNKERDIDTLADLKLCLKDLQKQNNSLYSKISAILSR